MWSRIKQAYGDSARILTALPLLFALPVAAELVQHFIEYRAGMFASVEAMEATAADAGRMGFGQVKVLVLMLLPFWVARWHFFRGRRDRPILGDRRSIMLYVPVVLLGIAIGLVQQFGGSLLSPYVPDARVLMAIGFLFFAATVVLDVYLTAWKIGAALGNPRMTIPASFRVMHGNFWWSLGFFVVMFLPLMVVHYGLNGLAIGKPDGLLWTILAIDSLVVGYLGLVLAMTTVLMAGRAAERSGVALVAA